MELSEVTIKYLLSCSNLKTTENDKQDLSDYCVTGKLESFKDNGCEILSVDSVQKNKNYKAVFGRICNMFRPESWSDAKKERGITLEKDLIKEARKECNVVCSFVIYCGKDDSGFSSLDDSPEKRKWAKKRIRSIADTMKSCEQGKILPYHIIVVNHTESISAYDFLNWLRIECSEIELKSKWNMEYITGGSDVNKSEKEDVIGQCLDIVIKNSRSHYFSLFFEGDSVPENYLSDIDSYINDESKRFLILTPKDEKTGGLFMQKIAYSQFGGNKKGVSVLEKITQEAEEQECKEMIQPLSSVVKSL